MSLNQILFTAFVIEGVFSEAFSQASLELYDRIPPYDTFKVTTRTSRPYLPVDLQGSSYICCLSGIWVLYHYGYSDYVGSGGLFPDPGCCEDCIEHSGSAWLIQSSLNVTIQTINLFPDEWWSSAAFSKAFTQDQPSYSGIFNSIVVTGATAVTFYKETNYQGSSYCLKPFVGYSIPFAGDLEFLGDVLPGEIKSFRFGCFGENVVSSGITSHSQAKNIRK